MFKLILQEKGVGEAYDAEAMGGTDGVIPS